MAKPLRVPPEECSDIRADRASDRREPRGSQDVSDDHAANGEASDIALDAEHLARILYDGDPAPIAITDPHGTLLWAAPAALSALRRHGVDAEPGARIAIPDEARQPLFERFVKSDDDGKRFLIRSDSGRDWTVIRLRPCEFAGNPARLLHFAFSGEEIDCSRNGLADFFGLTPTEVTVLNRFTRLYSPEDVAREMGISRETVRSHLKRIRAKTGVHGGHELIRLVATFGSN